MMATRINADEDPAHLCGLLREGNEILVAVFGLAYFNVPARCLIIVELLDRIIDAVDWENLYIARETCGFHAHVFAMLV